MSGIKGDSSRSQPSGAPKSAAPEAEPSAALPTGGNLLELDGAENAPVSAPMGVAMIALNMAFKWHDLGVIKDGALYQQFKLEGRNIPTLHLDMVFETAKRIERHLLVSSREISDLLISGVLDALIAAGDEEDPSPPKASSPAAGTDPAREEH